MAMIVAGFIVGRAWGFMMGSLVVLAWLVLTRAFEIGQTRETGAESVLPTVGERPLPGWRLRATKNEEE